MFLHIA